MLKIQHEIRVFQNQKKAKIYQKFFKTGKGEYGEGDLFLGLTVPQSRKIAKKYSHLSFINIKSLLKSPYHEERLVAILLLIHNFEKGNQKLIFNFYLKNIRYINNWDLVDLSADKIVGAYLLKKKKDVLYKLAKSKNLWEKRISIIATFNFIKNNEFSETFKVSQILLNDSHDLIHKAVGWMLREVGNRNRKAEETFLKPRYKKMPRTMLRYAIEKFPENKRQSYLKGKIL